MVLRSISTTGAWITEIGKSTVVVISYKEFNSFISLVLPVLIFKKYCHSNAWTGVLMWSRRRAQMWGYFEETMENRGGRRLVRKCVVCAMETSIPCNLDSWMERHFKKMFKDAISHIIAS